VNTITEIGPEEKKGLHPRNKNNSRYNFQELIHIFPELQPFVFTNRHRRETINFALPEAVRTLNQVLLKHFYGITYWDIPKDYLCPPIPGRADYIHHIADLLASCNENVVPRSAAIRVLDIGVGANCIFPILGNKEYGWSFIGSEIDTAAVVSAQTIIDRNAFPIGSIVIRKQENLKHIFTGIVRTEELFDISMCNPPFHPSLDQAEKGTRRKWKNLGVQHGTKPALNFGGQSNELWYQGGEAAFVRNMIDESAGIPKSIFWFSTLISKRSALPVVYDHLKDIGAFDVKTIDMSQGQKKSRIVSWTFLNEHEQKEWRCKRWIDHL
jgi:23S rRNA (adenine1618-N6)-methyltransferase